MKEERKWLRVVVSIVLTSCVIWLIQMRVGRAVDGKITIKHIQKEENANMVIDVQCEMPSKTNYAVYLVEPLNISENKRKHYLNDGTEERTLNREYKDGEFWINTVGGQCFYYVDGLVGYKKERIRENTLENILSIGVDEFFRKDVQSELLNISKQDIEKKTDTIIKDIWNVPYEMIQTFSIAGDEFRVLCQNAKNYINYLENAIPVSSQEFCLVRIGFLQDGLAVYNAGTDIPISSVLEKSLEYSVGAQMVFDENGIRQFTIQNPYQIKKVKKRGAIISADKALENATKIITNEISLSANERVEIFHMNMEYILQDKDEQMVVVPYWVIAYKDAEDIFAVRINALTGENFAYGG